MKQHPRKYRPTPRISAPKLAEFLVCVSPSRRAAILRDQAFPAVFKVATYGPAKAAIGAMMLAGGVTRDGVARSEDHLRSLKRDTKWTQDRLKYCSQALMHSLAAPEIYKLPGGSWHHTDPAATRLTIGGVQVSVLPDLVRIDRKSGKPTGALMLVCSKEHALSAEEAHFLATLLRLWILKLDNSAKLAPKDLLVIDVFHRARFSGPANHRRRTHELTSACLDIYRLWPQAPSDSEAA